MVTTYFCIWAVLSGLAFKPICGLNPLKMITSRVPKLHAGIEKLVQCADFPNTPIQFKNMIINQVGFNQFSVWGNISINDTFDRPIRLESELSQCSAKGDANNCEYYYTYKQGKICDLLESGATTWEYFTKYTNLPKQCPFPPKTYYINGSTIDLQSIRYLPVFRSYWHIKNKGFQDDKLMFCVVSEVSLKMAMNHTVLPFSIPLGQS